MELEKGGREEGRRLERERGMGLEKGGREEGRRLERERGMGLEKGGREEGRRHWRGKEGWGWRKVGERRIDDWRGKEGWGWRKVGEKRVDDIGEGKCDRVIERWERGRTTTGEGKWDRDGESDYPCCACPILKLPYFIVPAVSTERKLLQTTRSRQAARPTQTIKRCVSDLRLGRLAAL
ncbi:hypothetical protein PoB_002582900 [Plakobranchus ocellatus]|uniref:Uncharacterized protein n=1 Tax=Plakobranchus ocellatus TaxID=259542 RepID=A0AAV3ZZG0_9GAST|nr:hypothetical protein PoB_002582900 [Plakobranchus ocellatus]